MDSPWILQHCKRDQASNRCEICKNCFVKVRYTGKTTNMHSSLSQHHVELCDKGVAFAGLRPAQHGVDTFFQAKLHRLQRGQKQWQTGSLFTCSKGLRPYSEVENEAFRVLINILEPRFDIPSQKYFAEKLIPAQYSQTRTKVETALETADRVEFTCDGWTPTWCSRYTLYTRTGKLYCMSYKPEQIYWKFKSQWLSLTTHLTCV